MLEFKPIGEIIYIICLIFSIVYTVKKQKTFIEFFCLNLFIIFILLVIDITLFPLPIQKLVIDTANKYGWGRETNIIPFYSIINIIKTNGIKVCLYQIGGNLLMLAPIGIYIPITFKKFANFKKTLALGFFISASIEITQFIIGKIINYNYRTTDIDDIILNVIGVMFGYIIYLIIRPLYNKLLTISTSHRNNKPI